MVENEVRTSVETISSTSETSRSHMMPRLTGSKVLSLMASVPRSWVEVGNEVVMRIDGRHVAAADHAGALALLDQGRAGDGGAGGERVPVVDRPLRHARTRMVVGQASALPRLPRPGRPRQRVAGAEARGR